MNHHIILHSPAFKAT